MPEITPEIRRLADLAAAAETAYETAAYAADLAREAAGVADNAEAVAAKRLRLAREAEAEADRVADDLAETADAAFAALADLVGSGEADRLIDPSR